MSNRFIVLERDGHWAAAIRQELADAAVHIVETRSWDEVWQLVGQTPSALIAAELSAANAERILSALATIERRHPRAAMIVLADRQLASCRDLLLEAGALHFITSPRRLDEIRCIVCRRAERFKPSLAGRDRLEEIRDSLPWSNAERGGTRG
jgi:DNA-binding NarL/FixJ family response regulator